MSPLRLPVKALSVYTAWEELEKTVLAVSLAHDEQIRQRFSDGVFWLTVGQDPNVVRLQVLLASQIGPSRLFVDVSSGKQCLRQLLRQSECLIILDDVWRAEDVRAFDVVELPSRLLFTTREGGLITSLGAEEHCLDLLTDEQSLRLLADWSGQSPENLREEAQCVASECGNLPFAITLCGAMARDGVPWGDLLDALKGADLTFIEKKRPRLSVFECMASPESECRFSSSKNTVWTKTIP